MEVADDKSSPTADSNGPDERNDQPVTTQKEGGSELLGEKPRDLMEKESAFKSFPRRLLRLFRYARLLDWVTMLFGSICAMLNGSVLAISLFFLSSIIDAFVSIAISERFVADTGRVFSLTSILSEQDYNLLMLPIPYSDLSNVSVTANLSMLTGGVIDCTADIPITFEAPLDGLVVNITMVTFIRDTLMLGYYSCYDANGFIAAVNGFIYILIGIAVGSLVFGTLQSLTFQWVSNRMVKRLRLDLYRAILHQDQGWFDGMDNSSAVLSGKLTIEMDTLQDGIGRNLGNIVSYFTTFAVSLGIAFLANIYMTLVVLSPIPIIIVASAVLNVFTTKYASLEQKQYSKAGGVAEEVLSSIRTVVSLGGEHKEMDRFKTRLEKSKSIDTRVGLYRGISYIFIYFFLFFSVGIAVWYAAALAAQNLASDAEVLQVLFAIMVGSFFLTQAVTNIGLLNIAAATVDSSIDIIKQKPSIDSSYAPAAKEHGNGIIPDKNFEFSIEFKDVHFSYPTRPKDKILKGFNLKIKNGQRVAILGQSGSGKSTLLALLQRFYDIDEGQILIGGIDISKLNLNWLRSQMRTVLQEPVLFDTTIKENLQYGKLHSSKEQVIQSAKDANIHNAIKELPKSYNSSVGEHGGLLSGGQKQRVAIARALLGNPTVLMLDEATSALDVENEALLQSTISEGSKTVLIVTHRLPLVKSAHIVVQIEDGVVSWIGSTQEYMDMRKLTEEDEDHFIAGRAKTAKKPRKTINTKRSSLRSIRRQPTGRLARRSTQYSLDGDEEDHTEDETWNKVYSRLTIIKRLLQFNKKDWHIIVLLLIAATFAGTGFPLFGLFWGTVYDRLVNTPTSMILEVVNPWGSSFVVLGAVMALAYFSKTMLLAIINEKLTRRARLRCFNAMLRQDMAWFDEDINNTGNLTYILSDDARNIQGAGASMIAVLWEATVALALAYAVGFFTNWSLTLVMLLFVPFYLMSVFVSSKASILVVLRRLKFLSTANTVAIETIDEIQTVRSLQLEDTFYNKYEENIQKQDRWSLLISPLHPLPTTVIVLGIIISFRYAAFQTLQEGALATNIEVVLRTFVALVFTTISVGVLTEQQGEHYQLGKLSANKIFSLLDRTPELDNLSTEGEMKDNIEGNIEVKNVTFAYPTRKDIKILTNFSTSISPSQSLAVIGPSGSGKSTIVSLLERFYTPEEGVILLDGCDISTLNIRWLRSKIGIVSQEPVLFDLTIAENIRYGSWDRDISEEDVIDAAKAADIHDFIVSTAQGYDTKIGPRGELLSGGQKQRVAIARAILRDPSILLLDEATSALDEQTAELVQEALSKIQYGRTTIFVTHQLGTLQKADNIMVLKRGKVVEEGNPEELLNKKGYYYNVVHMKYF